jgi:hypothetical protein
LFLVCFAGALRRSELTAEGMRLLIARSKPDKEGAGAEIGISLVGRLDPDVVRQILKERASQAGITGTIWEPVTLHSMQAGFVTTAYKNGVPDEKVMGHTRHRSLTTMRDYVRRAKLDTKSPAGKLGL